MTVADTLREAKARIIAQGWCQGDEEAIHGTSGKCCTVTALDGMFIFEALDLLKDACGVQRNTGIAPWNDEPGRTVEEVIAAYDRAIEAAEAKETANV